MPKTYPFNNLVKSLKWGDLCHFVMFYVVQILLLFIFSLDHENSLVIRSTSKTKDILYSKSTPTKIETEDVRLKNETSFTTHIPLFQIINNLTKARSHDLKSNVFDKMLSDEILSIKQHFYEQDKKASTVAMTLTGKLATPTLQVKQKWSFENFNTKLNSANEGNHSARMNDTTSRDDKNYRIDKKENKVLELRSLPEATPHFSYPIYLYRETKSCTCVNHFITGVTSTPSGTCRPGSRSICTKSSLYLCSRCSSTLCTQSINLCSGSEIGTQGDVHLCTQSSSCSHSNSQLCTHKECTRGETFYSTAFYVTYEPFFIGITQPSNVLYYHPDVVNQLKLPKRKKHKHRKTTTRDNNDDLYYNDDLQMLKGQVVKHDKGSYEDFTDDDNSMDQSRHPGMILDIDKNQERLESLSYKETKDKKLIIKEKTINDILHDLKTYYSDSVIKDCYCSLMSCSSFGNSLRFSNSVLGILILLILYCLLN